MGNFFDVRVATLAFYLGMHTFIEYIFIYIQQPELAFFVNPTESGILVTQETVADIGGGRVNRRNNS
jgi:hypothetical protein